MTRLLTVEEFCKLPLRTQHEYLERLRDALARVAYGGDRSELPMPAPVDIVPDDDGLVAAVDAWLAGGAL